MNNDSNLYDIYLSDAFRDCGGTIEEFENGLRSITNIIDEFADTVLFENIMLSLGNDIEPIYPVSKFKTELDGKWIEDDGQKINEFLNQFKIIE